MTTQEQLWESIRAARVIDNATSSESIGFKSAEIIAGAFARRIAFLEGQVDAYEARDNTDQLVTESQTRSPHDEAWDRVWEARVIDGNQSSRTIDFSSFEIIADALARRIEFLEGQLATFEAQEQVNAVFSESPNLQVYRWAPTRLVGSTVVLTLLLVLLVANLIAPQPRWVATETRAQDEFAGTLLANSETEEHESADVSSDESFAWPGFSNAGDPLSGPIYDFYGAGEDEGSPEDFANAIRRENSISGDYYVSGISYAESGQFELAIENFDQALVFDPSSPNIYYNRGISYAAVGDYLRSIEDFNKSLSMDPNNGRIYYWRGVSNVKLGMRLRANEDFDKARSLGVTYRSVFAAGPEAESGQS